MEQHENSKTKNRYQMQKAKKGGTKTNVTSEKAVGGTFCKIDKFLRSQKSKGTRSFDQKL